MDKIENAKTEAEEVKVAMLENTTTDVNQKAEKCTSKICKESPAKPKGNQRMEYLRANKGLVSIVLISAAIIFAVVVAMLVFRESDGHSHGHRQGHFKVHNATEMP